MEAPTSIAATARRPGTRDVRLAPGLTDEALGWVSMLAVVDTRTPLLRIHPFVSGQRALRAKCDRSADRCRRDDHDMTAPSRTNPVVTMSLGRALTGGATAHWSVALQLTQPMTDYVALKQAVAREHSDEPGTIGRGTRPLSRTPRVRRPLC